MVTNQVQTAASVHMYMDACCHRDSFRLTLHNGPTDSPSVSHDHVQNPMTKFKWANHIFHTPHKQTTPYTLANDQVLMHVWPQISWRTCDHRSADMPCGAFRVTEGVPIGCHSNTQTQPLYLIQVSVYHRKIDTIANQTRNDFARFGKALVHIWYDLYHFDCLVHTICAT